MQRLRRRGRPHARHLHLARSPPRPGRPRQRAADWLAGGATFGGPTAKGSHWIALGSSGDAGALKAAVDAANLGKLVVGFYRAAPGSDGKPVPGHACIVLPQSAAAVGDDGPHVMSVADVNRPDTPMKTAFHAHPEAWPDRIALYAHGTDLEKDSTGSDGGNERANAFVHHE